MRDEARAPTDGAVLNVLEACIVAIRTSRNGRSSDLRQLLCACLRAIADDLEAEEEE